MGVEVGVSKESREKKKKTRAYKVYKAELFSLSDQISRSVVSDSLPPHESQPLE